MKGWPDGTSGGVVLVLLFKVLDLLLGFVLRDAVGFLDLAHQLIALAGDNVEVVVGKLAPLRLHLALELLPVAFYDIPVHLNLLGFGFRLAELPVGDPLFQPTVRCMRTCERSRREGPATDWTLL